MAALGNQGVGLGHAAHGATRHIPQAHHQPPLNDSYNSQHGRYALQSGTGLPGQGSFSQGHSNHQMHSLQPQSIAGYVCKATLAMEITIGVASVESFCRVEGESFKLVRATDVKAPMDNAIVTDW
jgi:hypothetical protein